MAQTVAFQAVLQGLGCPPTAIQAISANGITTTQDLIGITDKDVEDILKIHCPEAHQYSLLLG
jgi:hypothetical protein